MFEKMKFFLEMIGYLIRANTNTNEHCQLHDPAIPQASDRSHSTYKHWVAVDSKNASSFRSLPQLLLNFLLIVI